MRVKRLISLAMALALMLTLAPLPLGSHAEEKLLMAEDFEITPINLDYDVAEAFLANLAVVKKNDKYGMIDIAGNIIIPIIYDGIDAHINYFLESEYDDTDPYSYELISALKDGKRGFFNKDGKLVIPFDSKSSSHYSVFFSDGLAVTEQGGKIGFIDETNKIVIPIQFDEAGFFQEGIAPVKKDGKWGFIDKKGNTVINFNYDGAFNFYQGLASVTKYERYGVKYGAIDKQGNVVFPFDYEEPLVFWSKFSVARKSGKSGLIDITGKIIIPIEYDKLLVLAEGSLIRAEKNGKYGYFDSTGRLIVPMNYDVLNYDDLKTNDLDWHFILEHSSFSEDMLLVYRAGRVGYIDRTGREVIPPSYEYAEPFREGVAKVKKEGKYGYIDKNENFIFPLEYDALTTFRCGHALARKDSQAYVIKSKNYKGKTPKEEKGYVYDEFDEGEGLILPTDELAAVTDKAAAAEAVTKAIAEATEEQKTSATGTDLLTLYSEEAALRVAKTEVEGSEFIIDKVGVEKVENAAIEAKEAVEIALKDGGVMAQRELSTGVIYEVKEGDKLSVKVDASSAEAKADNVRVETPTYSLSFNKKALASIKEEGAEPLEITVAELPAENAALPRLLGTQISSKAVGANLFEDAASKIFDIKFSKKMTEKVKLSLPVIKGNPNYQAVFDSEGKAIGGKYNPVTKKLDVKINKSDKYVVKEKKKSFADITSKSKEMQDAIEILASKGIIAGTSPTNFSPDGTITRAEIAALILRSISKLNPSENGGFSDVTSADWYFGAVGSAKKHGIMNGVSKTLFSPKSSIKKEQIVAVAARVLKEEMGYLAPEGPEAFLGAYTDSAAIPAWAKSDVALATREGLVVKRYDGAFIPAGTMTRGDVAVILHRLFKKLW